MCLFDVLASEERYVWGFVYGLSLQTRRGLLDQVPVDSHALVVKWSDILPN
jgi:hypothetical protein